VQSQRQNKGKKESLRGMKDRGQGWTRSGAACVGWLYWWVLMLTLAGAQGIGEVKVSPAPIV